jgi:hypothetical protein
LFGESASDYAARNPIDISRGRSVPSS